MIIVYLFKWNKMRITIWLSITVFVTTLFWPHLLNRSGIFACVLIFLLLIVYPKWRYLAILPLTALYFNSFTYTTLLGLANDYSQAFTLTNKASFTQPELNMFSKQQVNLNKQQASFFSTILSEHDNTITIQIKSLINAKNNGYFIAEVISINHKTCQFCPLIEMRWFRPTLTVQSGQIHQFKVRFKALQGKGNPENFDRQKWRYSEHIAYIANIKQHIKTIDPAISVRAKVYQKALLVTSTLEHQGAILALIFADKQLMSDVDRKLIKELGIAHLFAISGLHIGLMFAFSFFLFNFFIKKIIPVDLLGWFSWRLVNLLCFLVCLGYAYISGFSLPTQRALVMLLLSLLVLSSRRKAGGFDLLTLCFWLVIVIDPLAILSSSLWLSFTAISTILIFIWIVFRSLNINHQLLSRKEIFKAKALAFIKWLILLQLTLTLLMLPIQLINFSAFSLGSFAINLIAIPVFSWLIIPVTLLGAACLVFIEPVGIFLLSVANNLLHFFFDYFDFFSAGYVKLSAPTITLILSGFVFILLLLFLIYSQVLLKFKKNMMVALALCFMSFIIVRYFEKEWQMAHSWQIEFFDIGQGLAVLVRSNESTLLYDTGPSYHPYYVAAKAEILPYLQARNITKLDYLFISHSDNDHSGGANTILHNIDVKHLYSGDSTVMNQALSQRHNLQKDNHLTYEQCLKGQYFKLGHLSVEVLSPIKEGKDDNNNSCVLKVSDGVSSLLLTGDINKDVERSLLYNAKIEGKLKLLTSDILVAPHHGSKTSSSIDFIKQVNPHWVIFSAGYKNRWKFPILEVVQRYQKLGVIQITTGELGFIRFNVQNQHIKVKTYREDLAAYWYHHLLKF